MEKDMAIKTYLQAINDAMRQEMERDENVFIIGEDVGKFGGCFGVTQGPVSYTHLRIQPPWAILTANSMLCTSWRTLPGQA